VTVGISIALVILSTVFGAFGPIFIKKSNKLFSLNMILGFTFYAISLGVYLLGLKGASLSLSYPFTALMYVWVMILAVILLGERMTKKKLIGTILVVLGIILIGLGMI